MVLPAIEDMETAEAVAKIRYDNYEWSGCAGSRWEALPAEVRRRLASEAAEWLSCIRAANPG